ncbi:hypothetical protein ACMFMG_008751 [Clarireedia jacksonii]
MTQYGICFATVPNDFKSEWQNKRDTLQAFQIVPSLGKRVKTVDFQPKGMHFKYIEHEKRQNLEKYNLIVRSAVDLNKSKEIYTVGVELPTQLKELGWDGDDYVFWRVFWQKCINEEVLKLDEFKTQARKMYKLEEQQPNLTLANELKNAMEAMKSAGKGKEKEVIAGSNASGDGKPESSGQRVSRKDNDKKTTRQPSEERNSTRDSKKSSKKLSLRFRKKKEEM